LRKEDIGGEEEGGKAPEKREKNGRDTRLSSTHESPEEKKKKKKKGGVYLISVRGRRKEKLRTPLSSPILYNLREKRGKGGGERRKKLIVSIEKEGEREDRSSRQGFLFFFVLISLGEERELFRQWRTTREGEDEDSSEFCSLLAFGKEGKGRVNVKEGASFARYPRSMFATPKRGREKKEGGRSSV